MSTPIIGQPEIEDFITTIQLRCPCGKRLQIVDLPGFQKLCDACGKIYRVGSRFSLTTDGVPSINIGVGQATKSAPPQDQPPAPPAAPDQAEEDAAKERMRLERERFVKGD